MERYNSIVEVINDDLLNLRLAMFALGVRLSEGGLTDAEMAGPGMKEALEWVSAKGLERVSRHMIVALWSAFEVFVEDVFVLVCSESAPDPTKVPSVRISLGEFMTLNDDERWRLVWNRAESRTRGVDRYDDLFKCMGLNVDVTVTAVADTDGLHMDNKRARKLLRELEAVRNVIVHRGELADRRLVQLAPDRFRVGEHVEIPDDYLLALGLAVHNYAAALGHAAGSGIEVG